MTPIAPSVEATPTLDEEPLTPEEPSTPTTAATPAPEENISVTELAPVAEFVFVDNTQARTGSFSLTVDALPALPTGVHYELWLRSTTGNLLNLGSVLIRVDHAPFVGSTNEPLLSQYEIVLLSVEADGSAVMEPSAIIFAGRLTPSLLMPLRTLFFGESATEVGALIGLVEQAQIARTHSRFLVDALAQGGSMEARRHAEHITNVLEGMTGENYGDLNGDGLTQNPGDGFGLMVYRQAFDEQLGLLAALPADRAVIAQMQEDSTEIELLVTEAKTQTLALFDVNSTAEAQPIGDDLLALMQEVEARIQKLYTSALQLATIDLIESTGAFEVAPLEASLAITTVTTPSAVPSVETPQHAPTSTRLPTSTPRAGITPSNTPTMQATEIVTPSVTPTFTPGTTPQTTPIATVISATVAAATPRVLPTPQGDYWVNPIDGAEYVYVPAGEFEMGADAGVGILEMEQPKHQFKTGAFWIQRTEVTNAQYARCVDDGTCTPPDLIGWDEPARADYPVTNVTWHQANDYAEWAGGKLPSEAEWEKSCRGDDGRLFPWGNDPATGELANYADQVGTTTQVGSYLDGASPYGALDMSGNVREWTSSLDFEYPYTPADGREDTDFEGSRIVRSSFFANTDRRILCVSRFAAEPTVANEQIGFRVLHRR
jgi:formylglycine-generating enzyme required for sulfatase activity